MFHYLLRLITRLSIYLQYFGFFISNFFQFGSKYCSGNFVFLFLSLPFFFIQSYHQIVLFYFVSSLIIKIHTPLIFCTTYNPIQKFVTSVQRGKLYTVKKIGYVGEKKISTTGICIPFYKIMTPLQLFFILSFLEVKIKIQYTKCSN